MFLEFEGIDNVRDPGGMIRTDGARIRSGCLLRTARLENATPADIARLQNMGLCAVFDFRDPGEIQRAPDKSVPGADYYSLPALPSDGGPLGKPGDGNYTAQQCHEDFRYIYRLLAQSSQAINTYKEFFRLLLEKRGRLVLWHCTQGKDRTGIAMMLVLSALGFDEEQILDEFMLTNQFTLPQLEKLLAEKNPPDADILREVFTVWRENAQLYLQTVKEDYGSVMAFLESALGVGPAEIRKLEEYYLERE